MYQFEAKDLEIKPNPLYLGKIIENNMKRTLKRITFYGLCKS